MKTPHLILKIDPQADTKNCLNFLKEEDKLLKLFLPADLRFILQPNFDQKERIKITTAYTLNAHQNYAREMSKTLSEIKSSWKKISPDFYRLTEQIFDRHPWPKGNYYGFGTIFCMFPRYIKHRTFFLPTTKNKLPLQIIAHEMLHFIFFDYLEQNFHLHEKSILKNKPKNFVWIFSEAFNNMLENWSPYYSLFHTKGSKYFDSQVNQLAAKIGKKWSQKSDLKKLIDNFLLN